MPQAGARGQNLEHLRIFVICCFHFSFTDLFVFKNIYYLWLTFSLSLLTVGFSAPRLGYRSKCRTSLQFCFAFLSFVESFVVEQHVLYSSLSDFRH